MHYRSRINFSDEINSDNPAHAEAMMTLSGMVQNGVVVLDNGHDLAEGTRVEVVVPQPSARVALSTTPTLDGLLDIAGTVKNLPPDFAAEHDHYLHGTPKR